MIESLVATQELTPVIQSKRVKKKKDQPIRYIRKENSTESLKSLNLATISKDSQDGRDSNQQQMMSVEQAGDSDDPTTMTTTISRTEFYKIRPKIPKISKNDSRRSYAYEFAKAYNSCDLNQIWKYLMNYCHARTLFIQRWVGKEKYLNFPKYLEIIGLEKIAEYWFSRCVLCPDLILELKETKLYVRSDGLSTVLSSFTIRCTRMYDNEVSDQLICKETITADHEKEGGGERDENLMGSPEKKRQKVHPSASSSSLSEYNYTTREFLKFDQSAFRSNLIDDSLTSKKGIVTTRSSPRRYSSTAAGTSTADSKTTTLKEENEIQQFPTEAPEYIHNRVFEKMKQILLAHMLKDQKESHEKAEQDSEISSYLGIKRRIEEENEKERQEMAKEAKRIQLFDENNFHQDFSSSSSSSSSCTSSDAEGEQDDNQQQQELKEKKTQKKRKKIEKKLLLPQNTSITLLGTLTLHLNQNHQIQQTEVTFALKK